MLRVGLHSHLLNIAPSFAPDWYVDAFNELNGFPCFIQTKYLFRFSTVVFVQYVITILLKFYKCISIKYGLHGIVIILNFKTHGRFNCTTSKMVIGLFDADREKRQRKKLQCLDDPPGMFSKFSCWETQKTSVN